MTLAELGASLREEREKHNLNIEDVARHLKISPRLLRALEEADASALPHLAYAKGFIRSYAGYLGMSTDEITAAVNALGCPTEQPLVPQPLYEGASVSPASAKGRKHVAIALLAALCFLVFIGATLWKNGAVDRILEPLRRVEPVLSPEMGDNPSTSPNIQRDQKTPGDVQKPAGADHARPSPSLAGGGNAPSAAVQPEAKNGARDDGASIQKETASQPEPGGRPAGPAERGMAASVSGQQHKIIIVATESCWIDANADGTDTRQFTLRKGDTFALTFTKNLSLKLGNAGGVRIRYNGGEIFTPGNPGQVKTMRFPPAAHE